MLDYKIKKTPGNTEWFRQDRFGMFIHFGLYSMSAIHEWYKTTDKIFDKDYDKYFKYFNPDLFDAKEWAKKAKKAGMKYAVLTTKHHEGFCMFDSKYTDYKITNTAFGRDLVKEYVDAFRAEGLKIGFYYSLIDWHHPEFPIDGIHPRRDDGEEMDRGRDMKKYTQYLRNQVEELMTNYGKIDIIWFDYATPNPDPVAHMAFDKAHPAPDRDPKPWYQYAGRKGKEEYESEKLVKMIRSYQPEIIINDRLDYPQDIFTPEQVTPTEWRKDPETGEYLTWEACHTFSGVWGYSRDEVTWKTPEMLINLLIRTVSLGGNLIMNVGPTSRGCFDERADSALDVYAKWMRLNGRSIYSCTMADSQFTPPQGCMLTQSVDGKRLYVHLIEYPFNELRISNLSDKIDYVQFLHDGSEIKYTVKDGTVAFEMPVLMIQKIVPVIEIFLK